nr:MAG TPA: hypothetical protein [Caudoviricetes sp.]
MVFISLRCHIRRDIQRLCYRSGYSVINAVAAHEPLDGSYRIPGSLCEIFVLPVAEIHLLAYLCAEKLIICECYKITPFLICFVVKP